VVRYNPQSACVEGIDGDIAVFSFAASSRQPEKRATVEAPTGGTSNRSRKILR
jgi:hypothetical protein